MALADKGLAQKQQYRGLATGQTVPRQQIPVDDRRNTKGVSEGERIGKGKIRQQNKLYEASKKRFFSDLEAQDRELGTNFAEVAKNEGIEAYQSEVDKYNAKYADDNVKLETGEWIPKEQYNNLVKSDLDNGTRFIHIANTEGVESVNKAIKDAIVQLPTGESVSRESFAKLSTDDQELLMRRGVDYFSSVIDQRNKDAKQISETANKLEPYKKGNDYDIVTAVYKGIPANEIKAVFPGYKKEINELASVADTANNTMGKLEKGTYKGSILVGWHNIADLLTREDNNAFRKIQLESKADESDKVKRELAKIIEKYPANEQIQMLNILAGTPSSWKNLKTAGITLGVAGGITLLSVVNPVAGAAAGGAFAGYSTYETVKDWGNMSNIQRGAAVALDVVMVAALISPVKGLVKAVAPPGTVKAGIDAAKAVKAAQTDLFVATQAIKSNQSALLSDVSAATRYTNAVNKARLADDAFIRSLSNLEGITPRQLSRIEKLTGFKGLKSSLVELSGYNNQINSSWKDLSKLKIGTDAYVKELTNINGLMEARNSLLVNIADKYGPQYANLRGLSATETISAKAGAELLKVGEKVKGRAIQFFRDERGYIQFDAKPYLKQVDLKTGNVVNVPQTQRQAARKVTSVSQFADLPTKEQYMQQLWLKASQLNDLFQKTKTEIKVAAKTTVLPVTLKNEIVYAVADVKTGVIVGIATKQVYENAVKTALATGNKTAIKTITGIETAAAYNTIVDSMVKSGISVTSKTSAKIIDAIQTMTKTTVEAKTADDVDTAINNAVEDITEALTQPLTETQLNTAVAVATKTMTKTANRLSRESTGAGGFVLPGGKKVKEDKKRYPKGTVAWKQGIGWWVIKPPYRSQDREFTLSKPKGAIITGNAKKAIETIQAIGGDVPDISFELGFVDVSISKPPSKPGADRGSKAITFKRRKIKEPKELTRFGPYHYKNGKISRRKIKQ